MKSVMDTARQALTGKVVSRMSSLVHESESSTRQVFEQAVPVTVAGLASTASTEAGAQALLQTFKHPELQMDPADLGRAVSDSRVADQVVSAGEGLTSRLFGHNLGGVVDTLAGESGVSRSSASKLLGLAMPIVMGIVGKSAAVRHMDARGLSGFLGQQLRLVGGAIPDRLTGLFGLEPALAGAGAPTGYQRPRESIVPLPRGGRPSILPWVAAGIIVVAGALWLSARLHQRPSQRAVVTEPATPPASTPRWPSAGAVRTAPPAAAPRGTGSIEGLSEALAGAVALPVRFTIPDLTFRADAPEIAPGSGQALDELATALQAHPTAKVRVEAHTDNTGDDAADLTLSRQRAESVKSYLTAHGAAPAQVEAAGFGSQRPVAPNDTMEGRARNGRTELVVTEVSQER